MACTNRNGKKGRRASTALAAPDGTEWEASEPEPEASFMAESLMRLGITLMVIDTKGEFGLSGT
jgi:hypothetical protein